MVWLDILRYHPRPAAHSGKVSFRGYPWQIPPGKKVATDNLVGTRYRAKAVRILAKTASKPVNHAANDGRQGNQGSVPSPAVTPERNAPLLAQDNLTS